MLQLQLKKKKKRGCMIGIVAVKPSWYFKLLTNRCSLLLIARTPKLSLKLASKVRNSKVRNLVALLNYITA